MRVLLQRCLAASVEVEGDVVGRIDRGLLLLVGVGHDDSPATAVKVADKVVHLRIFRDEGGHMNRSLLELSEQDPDAWGILVVSQFTLYADVRKGRRPSFVGAARPDHAVPVLDAFVKHLRGLGLTVETGRFGAEMRVALTNDGPVTIWLDSAEL